ncbi:hypothetical protein AB0F43_06885 [Kribbella sp. NPDC023972]|uniref:hypothetical protein n=1 Tax=Kribbella sp. NPDC023972 TaxID=3154795 RepID=UPI0033C92A87
MRTSARPISGARTRSEVGVRCFTLSGDFAVVAEVRVLIVGHLPATNTQPAGEAVLA